MRISILRTAVVAVAMPIIFLVGWFLCQWAWWIIGFVYDVLSPFIGPRDYDPNKIGLLQQLFRDLVPAAAAMAATAWAALNFFQGVKMGYRIGTGIILAGLAVGAVFTTSMALNGNPILSWPDLILAWATVGVVAVIARWADAAI